MRSVLLVEDDPAISQLTAWALTRLGYDVGVAASGDEALALVRLRPFHVALIDLKLPGMMGDALARALSDDPANRGLVLLGWTAAWDHLTDEQAAAFHKIIPKSADLPDLAAALDDIGPSVSGPRG